MIFTGNGYSAEWPVEASKRGLPNLNTTPKAIATWNSEKNKKLLESLKIYTAEETEARQEVMYENYISCMSCEVETMVQMTETGILPACAKVRSWTFTVHAFLFAYYIIRYKSLASCS